MHCKEGDMGKYCKFSKVEITYET